MVKSQIKRSVVKDSTYSQLVNEICDLLSEARGKVARSVNTVLTATNWEIGRRIVEYEQGGKQRADYGEEVLGKLSADLIARVGRGFSVDNLELMRKFYLCWSPSRISESLIRKSGRNGFSNSETVIRNFDLPKLMEIFPLSWTHYVRLLTVKNDYAQIFYEAEALRNGWSVRQMERQIASQFYERVALSKNKAKLLRQGDRSSLQNKISAEEEIKNPFVLEFLNLKDEYSENDLEAALVRHLETFLLELGGDFTFVARQKRLRVGHSWYRVDLMFYHRKLRCLILIDLKLGKFTHADAGQMHLYLNYAREHWTHKDENPPVGLILCAEKDAAVAHYALEGLPNKILASEYKTTLPNEKQLVKEMKATQQALEDRFVREGKSKK